MAALRRDYDGRPLLLIALVVGGVGAIATALAIVLEPERALAAYLAVWCTTATLVLGAFGVLIIGYAANARWPAVVRRLGEAIAGGLPAVALLAIPLLALAPNVWPWVHPSPHDAHAVEVKAGWLSWPFFVVRTAIYLGVTIAAAECLIRWSRRRDERPGADLDRERQLSSVMLVVVGLVLTFGGFDWLMSLEPDWWSSGFGLYVLTGALRGGLALTIVLAWRGVARRAMPLTPAHFHALGRLLHAFVILWAYIAFFQAMLIQIADKPSEVTFYLDRQNDGWRVVTWLLILSGFLVPFFVLLSRRLKHHAGVLAAIAILVVAAQYLDMWWLVLPRIDESPSPSWTDAAALCGIGGLTVALCAWRMRGVPLLPVGDPNLAAGLRYETPT